MAVKYLPFYIYISKQFRDDCKYSSVMPPHKSLQFLDPTEIFKEFLPSSKVRSYDSPDIFDPHPVISRL